MHIRALENFNPNLQADPFRWIPKGLMLDLNDDTPNEPVGGNINFLDQVNGYTNAQFFNALDADVRSPQALRNRLLQENANRQQPQVNTLFQSYGY